jgi:hypothetical protein
MPDHLVAAPFLFDHAQQPHRPLPPSIVHHAFLEAA